MTPQPFKAGIVLLVRHAKATGQEPDAPLTPEGVAQADALAQQLCALNITRLVSSPWTRAQDTARPLAKRYGLDIQTDERLTERVLSGENLPDWQQHLQRSFEQPELSLTGGESGAAARRRIQAVLNEKTDPDGVTVFVTHGNLLALGLGLNYEGWAALKNPDVWVCAQPAYRWEPT